MVPRPDLNITTAEQAIIDKRHKKKWAVHERRRTLAARLGLLEGENRDRYEFRLFPEYDEEGDIVASDNQWHLCRFCVPWCLARYMNRLGLDFTVTVDRTAMRAGAAKRCRWIVLALVLAVGLFGASYVAWRRGAEIHEILHSPCYVCRRNRDHFAPSARDDRPWWHGRDSAHGEDGWARAEDDEEGEEARRALGRYARYAHGEPCALSDTWVAAIDREATGRWLNHSILLHATRDATSAAIPKPWPTRAASANPWLRYDRLWSGAVALSMWEGGDKERGGSDGRAEVEAEDWRNALPRLWVVGARGAGTTSLVHYLGAHPGVEVRRGAPAAGDGAAVPWDDHFFASVPHWAADELRGWLRRGWGAPTLRDHQGLGKLRVEVGPDYLWHAATGAAGAVRRATSKRPGLFLVLLADPVRLVQEAYERAREAGAEERESFADVVAEELPALARCLWWDGASPAEQRERLVSGHCGGAEPGRVGPPYLWRGLLSEFLAHWMRTATPGANARRHWYFVRAADLLHQPNRTLNRLAQGFLGLPAFDYGPHAARAWHPSAPVVRRVAPDTPWTQSWRSYVPRTEYLKHLRKSVADGLLEGAERAAKKVVPGLEAGLAARDKLHRLHCRLAGYVDTKLLSTERCLRPEPPAPTTESPSEGVAQKEEDHQRKREKKRKRGRRGNGGKNGKKGKKHGKGGVEDEELPPAPSAADEAQEREDQAVEALRVFYTPYQAQLMQLVDGVEDLRARFPLTWAEIVQRVPHAQPPTASGGDKDKEEGESEEQSEEAEDSFLTKAEDEYEEELRRTYLHHLEQDGMSHR